jgi:exoribonuclease-2
VRADTLPLVFRVPGTENLPRGSRISARITGMDLLTLDLHASLAARLDAPAQAEAEAADDDETEPVGALHLAIELEDSAPAAPDGSEQTTAPAPAAEAG